MALPPVEGDSTDTNVGGGDGLQLEQRCGRTRTGTGPGVGVIGECEYPNGRGVQGFNFQAEGAQGFIAGKNPFHDEPVGVFGQSDKFGILGITDKADGFGVFGTSVNGVAVGVFGQAGSNDGMLGRTADSGHSGGYRF